MSKEEKNFRAFFPLIIMVKIWEKNAFLKNKFEK